MQSLELTYGFTNSLVTKWFSVLGMLSISALWALWFTYVLHTGLNTKTATREMIWNWSLSSLSVVSAIVTYFLRVSGSVEDSLPSGIPGAQWCASFLALAMSQITISGCLAHLWWGYTKCSPRLFARATGMLCAWWAIVQFAIIAITMFGWIPGSWAGWWVTFLLGGSAVAELLIGISCLLLADMERGMVNKPRRAILSFSIFISAGCTIGITLSLAMVVCHLQSATVPWNVMSMLAPIYRVLFLVAHLCYQKYVLEPMFNPRRSSCQTIEIMQFARGRGSTSTFSDVSRSASASPTASIMHSSGSGTSIVETLEPSDTAADEDVCSVWQLRPASIASARSPPHTAPPSNSSTV